MNSTAEPHRRAQLPWSQVAFSLRNGNLRMYLLGHSLSAIGMWMQQTAELWLVFSLTRSSTMLGVYSVCRFGPVLLLGAPAGVLCDRFDRYNLLRLTQSLNAAAATAMAVLVWLSGSALVAIFLIVLVQGTVNALDNPLRRAFVRDIATDAELANAISLNSTVGTVSRTLGPAVAGLLITSVGLEWCFVANALSYGAVLLTVSLMDRGRLRPATPTPRARGQVRAGLRFAWLDRDIRIGLIVIVIAATFGWNWSVILPAYATDVFAGTASTFGMMAAMVGVGSLVGALIVARATDLNLRRITHATAMLAVSLLILALAGSIPVAALGLLMLGSYGTSIIVATQARLQLHISDAMSGRIMGLFSVGFVGSKPIGGLIGGWLVDLGGARVAFAAGAMAIGTAALWLTRETRHHMAPPVPELGT